MTGGGPVATQDHAFVLGCKGIGELLACRTNVNVLIGHIAEVLLAEASFRLCVRGHRLWQRNRDASLLACQDLFAVEVTAVGFPAPSAVLVSLATRESCDRPVPSLVTSCMTIR